MASPTPVLKQAPPKSSAEFVPGSLVTRVDSELREPAMRFRVASFPRHSEQFGLHVLAANVDTREAVVLRLGDVERDELGNFALIHGRYVFYGTQDVEGRSIPPQVPTELLRATGPYLAGAEAERADVAAMKRVSGQGTVNSNELAPGKAYAVFAITCRDPQGNNPPRAKAPTQAHVSMSVHVVGDTPEPLMSENTDGYYYGHDINGYATRTTEMAVLLGDAARYDTKGWDATALGTEYDLREDSADLKRVETRVIRLSQQLRHIADLTRDGYSLPKDTHKQDIAWGIYDDQNFGSSEHQAAMLLPWVAEALMTIAPLTGGRQAEMETYALEIAELAGKAFPPDAKSMGWRDEVAKQAMRLANAIEGPRIRLVPRETAVVLGVLEGPISL